MELRNRSYENTPIHTPVAFGTGSGNNAEVPQAFDKVLKEPCVEDNLRFVELV